MEEFGRCDGEYEMTFDDFDVRSIVYRKSMENLWKTYRTSIENLSNIYRKSMDLGWTWGRSWVDRGWILGVSGCIWVDHGPPPETQFSLVNDTFTQAFGRSKDKRFFILHAPPSARRNVRSHAFGCCLYCLLLLAFTGKKRGPALPVKRYVCTLF